MSTIIPVASVIIRLNSYACASVRKNLLSAQYVGNKLTWDHQIWCMCTSHGCLELHVGQLDPLSMLQRSTLCEFRVICFSTYYVGKKLSWDHQIRYRNAVRPCVCVSGIICFLLNMSRRNWPGITKFGVWVPFMETLLGIVCGSAWPTFKVTEVNFVNLIICRHNNLRKGWVRSTKFGVGVSS